MVKIGIFSHYSGLRLDEIVIIHKISDSFSVIETSFVAATTASDV